MVIKGLLAIALFWGACYPSLPPPDVGYIEGIVIASAPVTNATVSIWQLDENGQAPAFPAFVGTSDDQGRFRIDTDTLGGLLLVTAQNGETVEYWSQGERAHLEDKIHLTAVIPMHVPGGSQQVVISPLTTLTTALATARFRYGGKEDTYLEAVIDAYNIVGGYLSGVELLYQVPRWEGETAMDEEARYGLLLDGLSAMARHVAEASGSSVLEWNTVTMTLALVTDISDSNAILDGNGPEGPVELGNCRSEPCLLSPYTLRTEIVRTILRELLHFPRMRMDAELKLADIRLFMHGLATDTDAELFGMTMPEPLDEEGPIIAITSSRIRDESFDQIKFSGTFEPEHVHDIESDIELADAFKGSICPRVYKHVNLLHGDSDNPLGWNVEVYDELTGLPKNSVTYKVGIREPSGQVRWLTGWRPAALDGFVTQAGQYAIRLTSDAIPELAAVEGTFEIHVRARDWVDNWSETLVGCWEHVPLAPPLWVEPVDYTGPEAMAHVGLEADNLVPLIHGLPEDEGKVLQQFRVYNGTDDDVYLTLDYTPPVGWYQYVVRRSQAYVMTFTEYTDCLVTMSPARPYCIKNGTFPPLDSAVGPLSLAESFTSIRLVGEAGAPVQPCESCTDNQFRIRPRRSYYLQIVVRNMQFLRAVTGDMHEISIGPPLAPTSASGVTDGELLICLTEDGNDCTKQQLVVLFQALQSARISVDHGLIYGTSAPRAALPSRRPAASVEPGHATFFNPLPIQYEWETSEIYWPPTSDPGHTVPGIAPRPQ